MVGEELVDILANLQMANKIQAVNNGAGFLPIKQRIVEDIEGAIDWELLTEEERRKIE